MLYRCRKCCLCLTCFCLLSWILDYGQTCFYFNLGLLFFHTSLCLYGYTSCLSLWSKLVQYKFINEMDLKLQTKKIIFFGMALKCKTVFPLDRGLCILKSNLREFKNQHTKKVCEFVSAKEFKVSTFGSLWREEHLPLQVHIQLIFSIYYLSFYISLLFWRQCVRCPCLQTTQNLIRPKKCIKLFISVAPCLL